MKTVAISDDGRFKSPLAWNVTLDAKQMPVADTVTRMAIIVHYYTRYLLTFADSLAGRGRRQSALMQDVNRDMEYLRNAVDDDLLGETSTFCAFAEALALSDAQTMRTTPSPTPMTISFPRSYIEFCDKLNTAMGPWFDWEMRLTLIQLVERGERVFVDDTPPAETTGVVKDLQAQVTEQLSKAAQEREAAAKREIERKGQLASTVPKAKVPKPKHVAPDEPLEEEVGGEVVPNPKKFNLTG